MALADIKSPKAIRQAVAEFDRIGREKFLTKYGFGKARRFFLEVGGKLYDSKAIIGAAYGYEHPNRGPLKSEDFTGGESTVKPRLEALGFRIYVGKRRDYIPADVKRFTSERLSAGKIYSREDLCRLFGVTDATVNTGIFRPKGYQSVWLFLTEKKTRDRTQYNDKLDGDVLQFQGQTQGRTDKLIIEHERHGLEVLLFCRRSKREHPHGGFRYEGRFRYINHRGAKPTTFTLHRINGKLAETEHEQTQSGEFDPNSIEDARERTQAAIVRRRGQPAFRRKLLQAYGNRCAITDCDVTETLEAAHIVPYHGEKTNHVTNGLLLRADIHTLFDLGLIAIDAKSHRVVIANVLKETAYGELSGVTLRLPEDPASRPSPDALRWHRQQAGL